MATVDEIAALRLLINEPDDTNGWTDEKLGLVIDGASSINDAARSVWVSKASTYVTLVDVSESGSSRKLSDLHKNALAMAKYYSDLDGEGAPDPDEGPIVARIRRGFA